MGTPPAKQGLRHSVTLAWQYLDILPLTNLHPCRFGTQLARFSDVMAITWLYSLPSYLMRPSKTGIVVALLWFTGLLYLAYYARHQRPKWGKRHWLGFLLLTLLTPLLSAIALQQPSQDILLPAPAAASPAALKFTPLAALPWMLAAGFLGTIPAMFLAFLSGITLGVWNTHLPMESLVHATLAGGVSWALWQPYRTKIYRALRQPLIAASAAMLLYPFIFGLSVFLLDDVPVAAQLDFALSNAPEFMLYVGGTFLLAGIITQIIALWQPQPWGYSGPYKPSPLERSLTRRFSFVMTVFVLTLMVSIVARNWALAQRSARELIIAQLNMATRFTAQALPSFAIDGTRAIKRIASDPRLTTLSPDELRPYLEQATTDSAFFTSLTLVDDQGNIIVALSSNESVSSEDLENLRFSATMKARYICDTVFNYKTQRSSLTCYAVVPTQSDEKRYIIGRTRFDEKNPSVHPIVTGLTSLQKEQGYSSVILDEQHQVLFSTNQEMEWLRSIDPSQFKPIKSSFTTAKTGLPEHAFYDGAYEVTGPQGQRYLLVVSQALGTQWVVLTLAPIQQLQSIALQNALPLAAIVGLLAIVGIFISRSLARMLARSLRSLTVAAERIASGQLSQPLEVTSVDEIGQLRRAFEHMRQRLQARMSELSRLLHTSQRIAATLKVHEAADAVLAAAYSPECAAVRIALSPEALPDDWHGEYPTRFGRGLSAKAYASLDDQLISLARKQALIRFNQLNENTGLSLPQKPSPPRSLLAVALRYEKRFLGVLYIVYNTPHTFSDEETRYLSALGLQMAMAAYTARLYFMAEVRHQRLQAVLNASPDPILVTDNQERLILANAAARTQLAIAGDMDQPLNKVITHHDLLALLRRNQQPPYSDEVTLNNRVYFATVTSVKSNEIEIGRVCILRDITHFKELDTLKSEFVATVSHDLRVPLTLINGYLTMLEMVGQLNERQGHYVHQIQDGIQNMTQLVNNLLDLGRIEAGVGLQLQLTPVLDTIDEVAKRWQPHAKRKRITLTTDIAPDTPPLIEADPVLLDRALHNLVDNAIKYTPSGGKVVILGRTSGQDKILLGVKDSGVGISPIDQPRLFEKFFRISRRETPKEKGSGLGLAIVKSIVERHHGRVWVESQLGEGSTFFMELPLRQPGEKTDTLPI